MDSKVKKIKIKEKDYFAITSFYLSFFGFIPVCSFLAIVFGFAGLFSEKRMFALFGILFSLLWLFFIYLLAPFIITRGLI